MNFPAKPSGDRPRLVLSALRRAAQAQGFTLAGASGVDLSDIEPGLQAWLDAGHHGTMDYMQRHGLKRARPAELVPGTRSVLMVSLEYRPQDPDWIGSAWATLGSPTRAYVSRYALGRDYHKLVRTKLQRLLDGLVAAHGVQGRAFCDSAPVLEVELADRAAIGWRGKHTLLIHPRRGSMFFLGSLFLDREIEDDLKDDTADEERGADAAVDQQHCGSCTRCIDICPTRAIVAPWRVDARRCISYLTIEHDGPIPIEFRAAMGNRIYGCDDCQLVCPWNRFAQPGAEPDFAPRASLDEATLLELFGWTAQQFDERLQGSAIRRIGHARWRRNLAVALGNALRARCVDASDTSDASDPSSAADEHVIDTLRSALRAARDAANREGDELLAEHLQWALDQQPPVAQSPDLDQR